MPRPNVAADIVVVGRTNLAALVAGRARRRRRGGPRRRRGSAAVEWVRSHLGHGDAVLYENDLPDHYP